MPTSFKIAAAVIAIGCSQGAFGQMAAPPIPSELPNVASISPGNAAGVLEYCMKNNLVSSVSADAVLGNLNKKPNLTKSPDFTAGQAGDILGDKKFAIGKAPGYLQSRACDMVLTQAKQLL